MVAKLFNATKPHVAVFGRKDYQQLAVIKKMVKDLDMDLRIIGVPTVREPDGLAMSSRNSYLNPEERKSALSLKRSMDLASRLVRAGERSAEKVRVAVRNFILDHPFTEIDYVSIADTETLEELAEINGPALVSMAIRIGKTRLIDNIILGE